MAVLSAASSSSLAGRADDSPAARQAFLSIHGYKLLFKRTDLRDRHILQIAADDGIEDGDLMRHVDRGIAVLLQDFHDALALRQTLLRVAVEVGAELRRSSAIHGTASRAASTGPRPCFMALIWASPPTRDTEMPGFTAGMMPAWNSSVSRKIWPSVMEMTFVGM